MPLSSACAGATAPLDESADGVDHHLNDQTAAQAHKAWDAVPGRQQHAASHMHCSHIWHACRRLYTTTHKPYRPGKQPSKRHGVMRLSDYRAATEGSNDESSPDPRTG